jgi:hypothetical protein
MKRHSKYGSHSHHQYRRNLGIERFESRSLLATFNWQGDSGWVALASGAVKLEVHDSSGC